MSSYFFLGLSQYAKYYTPNVDISILEYTTRIDAKVGAGPGPDDTPIESTALQELLRQIKRAPGPDGKTNRLIAELSIAGGGSSYDHLQCHIATREFSMSLKT